MVPILFSLLGDDAMSRSSDAEDEDSGPEIVAAGGSDEEAVDVLLAERTGSDRRVDDAAAVPYATRIKILLYSPLGMPSVHPGPPVLSPLYSRFDA
ncbi:uncharacterized protein BDV17DRAFT_262359 [Aspergillus undulatus]|uniref:uncharacterized protein n=1 Tax=Aspergillus undulatus TaxID=1810928 RepID=UPI003CCD5593